MTEQGNRIKIANLLSFGIKNTTPRAKLCELLGITRQKLSQLIRAERREGAPICSNSNGYYLAACREEMETFCRRLRHRAGEIFATRRACLKTAAELPARGVENE